MNEHASQHEYRTGRTSPQKSRKGPVALLLICIIFLSGVISSLGLLNIRPLRWQSPEPEQPPVSFSMQEGLGAADTSNTLCLTLEGITFQELPSLYRQLYDLPQGLYICQVAEDCSAYTLGIAPGDVLTGFAGTAVSTLEGLNNLKKSCRSGDRVELSLYQQGKERILSLVME